MLELKITRADGKFKVKQVPDFCSIGKDPSCTFQIDHWRVGKEHARLIRTPAGVLLEDGGSFGGVSVNGQRVSAQYGPLKPTDNITVGPFTLNINMLAATDETFGQVQAPTATDVFGQSQTTTHAAPQATLTEPTPETMNSAAEAAHRKLEFEWRQKLHNQLLETMDLRRHDVASMSDAKLKAQTEPLIQDLLEKFADEIPPELNRTLLGQQVLNEAVGLGPLEELLADDSVSEIMVNRYDEIYIERAGRLSKYPLAFTGDRAVLGVIERIVAPLGRRIDESSPMVDARLKDGSRVNAIIPPLALKGPCLTIRKFAKRKLQAADLIKFGSVSPTMADFLEVCVVARKNMIVSGGTGSGKTTLLNILSNFIPSGERIITVEDAAELKLHHEHLISLESRPHNVEGKGGVLIRDLVKNTLRMRPDRIVVGECRGAEALDMLQAMNTGHEGSLTTLHANTPRDALARLETMVLMAGMDLPLTAIREQICSAVDVIVQQTRFSCGTRLITSITEITGMESGKIQTQEIFRYHTQGYGGPNGKVQGWFTGCDTVPSFYEELRATGRQLDMNIFRLAEEELALRAATRQTNPHPMGGFDQPLSDFGHLNLGAHR